MTSATVFAPEQWKAIDERQVNYDEFSSTEFEELQDTVARVSAGFPSYDAHQRKQKGRRKHLPPQMAEQLEQAAEEEAEVERNTIRLAPEELEQLKQASYDEGFEVAKQSLTEKNLEKFQNLEIRISTVLSDLIAQQTAQLTKLEQHALTFAVELAKKLVDQVVEVNPEYIVPLVQRSLRLAGGARIRKVKVSPQDYEFIHVIGAATLFAESEEALQFEADPTIREGCIVETSAGEIDANLDLAFERIKDSVLGKKRND